MKIVKIIVLIALFVYSTAGSAQEKIIVSISNNTTSTDDTLYIMNPNGTGATPLFNFHKHPKHNQGLIVYPRVSTDGKSIYFASDNAYAYTPASRNIFRISADGKKWEQLTPGPNSGKWHTPCPCGKVIGTVKRANGTPYGNSPIFLEGMGMIYSKPDGTFGFDKVPEGKRWIVAYRPGSTVFDSQLIYVARGTTARVDFIPKSNYRWSFQNPVVFGNRIYHLSGLNTVQWMQRGGDTYNKVYTSTGNCTGLTNVDGFDVGPLSGRLAVMDYQDGCPTNRGLYIADKNGDNLKLLVDMKRDFNWNGGGDVFWSPDESKIAVKASYNQHVCIFVFNAYNGVSLGYVCAPNTNFNLYNTFLHGWSPDGKWLLYSQYLNNPAQTYLFKVKVTPQGSLDSNAIVTLLSNVRLNGATWGRLVL